MDQSIYLVTLVGTALVLAAAFSSLIAFRFGAPLLLLFLSLGLAAGVDGLGIEFDNARLAYFVGALALAVILFESGFGTPLTALRQAAMPALSLATVGVAITTVLFGVAAFYLTDFGWLESFLLGAAVASTDAAAVFFLLRAGNLQLRDRVRSTLEIESGTNDPIAIFLTITLVEIIAAGADPAAEVLVLDLVAGFLVHMGLGAVIGLLGGIAIVRLVGRLNLDHGLLPIFVLTLSLLVFAAGGAFGGSGFLAVYLAGLVAGNSNLRAAASLKRFQDGVSWLAQIIMFLVLGLFATPSQFLAILPASIALGLFLIFIARPLAVWLCLIPFRFARQETAFISWVGLRGAVSILLAITPLLGGLEDGRAIFNTAFIVVLVSLVIQGWTVGPLARRLGLIVPHRIGPLEKVELELPGSAHHELLAYTVVAGSPVARGERIPRWARPSLVVREGRSMKYQDAGRLVAGDHVYIFVPDRYPRLLDRLFASRTEVSPDDADFFGEFAVDPARSAAELEANYSPGLTDAEKKLTIGQLMQQRLGGHAEYADRMTLGTIELIVRDVDEDGRITSVGLSLEPAPAAASIPAFLSPAELIDRIRGFLKRRSGMGTEAAEQVEKPDSYSSRGN
jgi:cell volume regulation protein A